MIYRDIRPFTVIGNVFQKIPCLFLFIVQVSSIRLPITIDPPPFNYPPQTYVFNFYTHTGGEYMQKVVYK